MFDIVNIKLELHTIIKKRFNNLSSMYFERQKSCFGKLIKKHFVDLHCFQLRKGYILNIIQFRNIPKKNYQK